MIRRLSLAFSSAAFVLLAVSDRASAQHVLVVDASGGGAYTQIQSAIDAAVDGDTILVKSGNYAGFTIDDKSVSVLGDGGVNVYVLTRVSVVALSSTRFAVLAGLQISPAPGSQSPDLPALSVQDDAGSVRIEACTILGTDQTSTRNLGSPGAFLSNSTDVAFSSSTIHGGRGGGGCSYLQPGAPGGVAVGVHSSRVAMYDCTLEGGDGGHGYESYCCDDSGDGGRGGAGCTLVEDGFAFASRTHFQGGNGGDGGDGSYSCMGGWFGGNGGPGGHGILVLGSASPLHCLALLDDPLAGGSGGVGGGGTSGGFCDTTGCPGHSGSAIVAPAGTVDHLSGAGRTISTPAVVRENSPFSILFHGRPGDVVWLYIGQGPAFVYNAPFHGVNLTTMPPVARPVRLGVIPSSGSLAVQRSMPDLGVDSRVFFMQGVFKDTAGARRLASPLTLVVLDSAY